MALRIWNGAAGDGNLSTAGNYVGGVAPVATDSLLFNQGNVDVTAGLTPGFAIADLTITPGYGGSIGDASGNPLTFTNITGTLSIAGNGGSYKIAVSGTCASAQLSHTLGTVYLSGGTWTLVTNTSGAVVIAASAVVVTGENIMGTWTDAYNATGYTTFNNGGKTTSKRNAATLNCLAGYFILQDNGSSNYTQVTTAANVYNGATYNKQSGATDALVNVFPGGRFTTEKNAGGSTGTVTITSTVVWAGGATRTAALPGVIIVPNISYKGALPGAVAYS